MTNLSMSLVNILYNYQSVSCAPTVSGENGVAYAVGSAVSSIRSLPRFVASWARRRGQ